MANTFKRQLASLTTADTPVTAYTVPALTTTVVIGFIISNKTAAAIEVEIVAGGKVLGTAIPIPAGSSISPLDGKLVLEAADTITVESDTLNSSDVILSIMEIA